MRLADECCPECHGKPEVVYKHPEYFKKKCSECNHQWFEERSQIEAAEPVIRKGNYIDRDLPIDGSRRMFDTDR